MIDWLLALINKRQNELLFRNRCLMKENEQLKKEVSRLNGLNSRRRKRPYHMRILNK